MNLVTGMYAKLLKILPLHNPKYILLTRFIVKLTLFREKKE